MANTFHNIQKINEAGGHFPPLYHGSADDWLDQNQEERLALA